MSSYHRGRQAGVRWPDKKPLNMGGAFIETYMVKDKPLHENKNKLLHTAPRD